MSTGFRSTDHMVLLVGIATAVLGFVCIVLLGVDKVMADEVAHEWELEGGSPGEWHILYIGLTVQMVYILIAVWKSARAHLSRGEPPPPHRIFSR